LLCPSRGRWKQKSRRQKTCDSDVWRIHRC
jgi:hypothetical protein